MTSLYTVAVIGAGTMGSGIAQKMAQEGLKVTLVDMKEEFVENGLNKIKAGLKDGQDKGIFTEDFIQQTLANISTTTNYEDIKDVDFVVEAVFEDLQVKKDVFTQLDAICNPKTILSSNTSSYYIKDLAAFTKRPDRVIGMHYFFPPVKNRLLEIIAHEGTSEETIQIANEISDLHNKTAITVQDSPGFAVNRFFVPFLTESTRIYEEGVANQTTIDAAAEKAFGISMGPFTLMNASGIPIAHHSAVTLEREISEFYAPPKTLVQQSESGEHWKVEGEVDESKFGIISERLLATTIGIAAALVDEGVASIEDTDRGAVVGLKWKVGPFHLANQIGIKKVYEWTERLSKQRSGFKLSEILKNQAEQNHPFEFQYIDSKLKNGVTYLTINRPEAMNALNPTVVNQLVKAFDKAEKDPNTKAIAIKGAGKAFVAGADIKFFIDCIKTDNIAGNVEFTSNGHRLFRRMETSPKKTIAILDGISLGGGSELALAAQEIVATDKGSLQFPESGLGIYPGLGGMLRFNKHLGKEMAKYFAMTGNKLTAQQAVELNIVSKLVSPAEVDSAVEELAQTEIGEKYAPRDIPEQYQEIITAFSDENIKKLLNREPIDGVSNEFVAKISKSLSYKGPNALKVINQLINQETALSIEDSIELELDNLIPVFETEEALVGLESSVNGSRPNFKELSSTSTNGK